MRLNAVLTLPTTGEPPYPAIAHPHGGPRSRDSLFWNSSFWDEWPQLLATRGYAVLQPNFRGSTGFGFDYYSAGNKEWGYKMQDDVDDGMRYLVEQGHCRPRTGWPSSAGATVATRRWWVPCAIPISTVAQSRARG